MEYSAREVCPPALLLQHLLRAHRIFLLHHASSLSELLVRTERHRFCSTLNRYWNDFVWNCDVLLNGNPAVDVFNGLKLAAGGELGIGVGEEEWGSGEREVLEDFIGRTEGLVDMLVSRFGNPSGKDPKTRPSGEKGQDTAVWKASGQLAGPSDGVVFSGTGALGRPSIRTISQWVETLFARGQEAYGVGTTPTSVHRPRRNRREPANFNSANGLEDKAASGQKRNSEKQKSSPQLTNAKAEESRDVPTTIPPSIMGPRKTTSQSVHSPPPSQSVEKDPNKTSSEDVASDGETGTETMIKYLTLGVYGSKWGIPFNRPSTPRQESDGSEAIQPATSSRRVETSVLRVGEQPSKASGHFLIGFQGELEGESGDEGFDTGPGEEGEHHIEERSPNSRTMLRTLHIERVKDQKESDAMDESGEKGALTFFCPALSSRDKGLTEPTVSVVTSQADRLRVIVYIVTEPTLHKRVSSNTTQRQPFIFVFLFELHTDSLAIPAFYRSIHHQLGPLQRPLLTSTSPQKVSERLSEALLPKSTASTDSSQPICDLVYDPIRLTVHTTIPNIPEPGAVAAEGIDSSWNRIEALNVHSQILNTFASTRRRTSELERTCKTSRGWWVVWMRLPHVTDSYNHDQSREAFLIRKASDYAPPAARKASGMFGRDVSGFNASGNWGPGKLAEGIGIDARQYIEGLLSLNR